jgi:hypothetical protein
LIDGSCAIRAWEVLFHCRHVRRRRAERQVRFSSAGNREVVEDMKNRNLGEKSIAVGCRSSLLLVVFQLWAMIASTLSAGF